MVLSTRSLTRIDFRRIGRYKYSGEDMKCITDSCYYGNLSSFSIIMIIKLENKFHFGIISQEMVGIRKALSHPYAARAPVQREDASGR